MNELVETVPFEGQSHLGSHRTCGAACLSMVYRSFGKKVTQAQIWPAIAKESCFGSLASTTHLMALDALGRGLSAVAIQARHPLQALRLCRDSEIRAILNHRLRNDAPTGHYSVLVNIDDKNVILYDPSYGSLRRLAHAELLELWQPRFAGCEIVGNMLIGVSMQLPAVALCHLCHTPIPSIVECPKCNQAVGLKPAELLGCVTGDCKDRMWNYLCCPSCDYTWTFSLPRPQADVPASASEGSGSSTPVNKDALNSAAPLDVNKLFGEVDKFCAHILGITAAANHPEIKKQLDHITMCKEKFKLAYAEHLVHEKTHQARLTMILALAKQRKEAHLKRMEELNAPLPPLDGNALAHALLQDLGLPE
jgi:Peptidase C39 family